MHSYYVTYYEKFRKIMQQTEKEALIIWRAFDYCKLAWNIVVLIKCIVHSNSFLENMCYPLYK